MYNIRKPVKDTKVNCRKRRACELKFGHCFFINFTNAKCKVTFHLISSILL